MGKIALTFDIDWANDLVLEELISELEKYHVKATFFATHKTPVLSGLDKNKYEVGIHPNFNPLLSGNSKKNYKQIVDDILNDYPEAHGVRAHSLFQSGHIFLYYNEVGLRYDSNIFVENIHVPPIIHSGKYVRIPFFWEDDVFCINTGDFEFRPNILNLNGCSVFDFHPNLLYLNVENLARYEKAKEKMHTIEDFAKYKNNYQDPGIRLYLSGLLDHIKRTNCETYLMKEIADLSLLKYNNEINK